MTKVKSADIEARITALDWSALAADLDARGVAVTAPLLSAVECAALAELYADEQRFRSHIIMARHGFGRGEYKYFAHPLPPAVAALRSALYPQLAETANRWAAALKTGQTFPVGHSDYLARCHANGQTRPTPLILKYEAGDYNCLHQDVYGELVFPLQAALLLSRPGVDFEGGEFVVVEQRPRMQSRVEVVPLTQGQAVIFAVRERPVTGTKGVYRVQLRHGVSRIRAGQRFTTGIIFHDAT